MQSKEFREDLFYRLNIFSVALPPLRERGADVLYLAGHFLDQYGNGDGGGRLELSEAARQKLLGYSWPGNVRELQAVMQRAALLRRAGILHAADIEFSEGKSKEILRHESLRRAKSFISQRVRTLLFGQLAQAASGQYHASRESGRQRPPNIAKTCPKILFRSPVLQNLTQARAMRRERCHAAKKPQHKFFVKSNLFTSFGRILSDLKIAVRQRRVRKSAEI